MNIEIFARLNRWWIGRLLNALLRPVFCHAGGNSLRFLRLVNACNCYPYAVGWDAWQLWISDQPSDVDEWRDECMEDLA